MGAQWYDANISHSRLRQEHARLPDGDGPPQSAGADGLRRHDQAGPLPKARQDMPKEKLDIVSAFQCYGEFVAGKIDETHAARRSSQKSVPAPAPAAACTRPTRWPRRSKRWACRCPTARRFRPKIPASSTNAFGPARRFASAGARHQAARHHDPAGVRKRDGRRDGPGRLDQRRAAPDRHGPRGGRAADDRRLPKSQRPRAVPGRSEAERQISCRKTCTTSAARRP